MNRQMVSLLAFAKEFFNRVSDPETKHRFDTGTRKTRRRMAENAKGWMDRQNRFTEPTFDGRFTQFKDGTVDLYRQPDGKRTRDLRPRGRGKYGWDRERVTA